MLSAEDNFSAQIFSFGVGLSWFLGAQLDFFGLDTFPRSRALRNWLIDEHVVVAPSPLLAFSNDHNK